MEKRSRIALFFKKSEIKYKFENEIDLILQKRKPMGITEEIFNDVRRQGAEEKERELGGKFEQKLKVAVLNLQKKGFPSIEIAEIMGSTVQEVERLSTA